MSQEKQVSEQIPKAKGAVCGGWTDMTLVGGLPSEEVKNLQDLLEKVREPAQVNANRSFSVLEPLAFATQVVAGLNYRIRAHTGEDRKAVFLIFKSLDGKITLSNYAEEEMQQTQAK
ncbi:cystatin-B-like [Lytechinus pictus]|uniref:cystatin-B-like n=1 Tax=Lytechinus pictus TaxID=7653 RepID=UPI00240E3036|nr:cystatin-B-like [Lytechinus pictus]